MYREPGEERGTHPSSGAAPAPPAARLELGAFGHQLSASSLRVHTLGGIWGSQAGLARLEAEAWAEVEGKKGRAGGAE